jgi:hypothetical protein
MLLNIVQVERFILMQVSESTCVERVFGRRMDPITNDIYHLIHMPPTDPEVIQRLVRREYDIDEKVVASRVKTYYAQLGRIIPHFQGKIQVINGFSSVLDVYKEICSKLEEELLPVITPEKSDIAPNVTVAQVTPPNSVCVVCMDAPSDYLAIPCGHQCGCETCLNSLKKSHVGCPICRTAIAGIVKVYKCGLEDDTSGARTTSESTLAEVLDVMNLKESSIRNSDWGQDKADTIDLKGESGEEANTTDMGQMALSITRSPTTKLTSVSIHVPEIRVRVKHFRKR